jgi:hypothetical protein
MWKNVQQSLLGFGVDSQLQEQILNETKKWEAILKILLDINLFLASRGLTFQDSNTNIGDVNNGNFLGVLKLFGHYNEVTREHLTYVQKYQCEGESVQGKAQYLS